MHKVFAIILLCLISVLSHANSQFFTKTIFFAGDIETFPEKILQQSLDAAQTAGFNAITLPIAWGKVEPQPGQFDVSPYFQVLDEITKRGLQLIIHLDASARPVLTFDGQRLELTDTTGVPKWLLQKYPDAIALDFSPEQTQNINLDYFDQQHLPALKNFYTQTIRALKQRYGAQITTFIPGLVHELEVKYAQWGYRWQSYTPAAQQAFDQWLQARGKEATALPVLNYSNQLGNFQPHPEPLLEDFMRFRENALRDYVCALTELIRSEGYAAGSYFGQSLTTHDAIYALGIIEELVDCLDEITVDYNYHDGWQVELNADVLPILVNYAHNLGYKRVFAGLYLEKFYADNGQFVAAYLPAVQQTLQRLQAEQPSGIEIGNVQFADLYRLHKLPLEAAHSTRTPKAAGFEIGIVASKWTYYLWHGEHSFERNLIQDALLSSYRLLRAEADMNVSILGEKALITQDLSHYDALLLPLQTTLSEQAAEVIRNYYQQGGKLIQDVQYRAFDIDGTPRQGWDNDIFGIGGLSWHHRADKFVVAGRRVVLPQQARMYFTYTLLAPKPDHQLLMRRFNDLQQGLMLRGARNLVFGFLPQLVDDSDKGDFWQRVFVDAIRDLVSS